MFLNDEISRYIFYGYYSRLKLPKIEPWFTSDFVQWALPYKFSEFMRINKTKINVRKYFYSANTMLEFPGTDNIIQASRKLNKDRQPLMMPGSWSSRLKSSPQIKIYCLYTKKQLNGSCSGSRYSLCEWHSRMCNKRPNFC